MTGFIVAGCITVFIIALLIVRYVVKKKGHEFPVTYDALMLLAGICAVIVCIMSLAHMGAKGSKIERYTGTVEKVITTNDGETSQVTLELNVNGKFVPVQCTEKAKDCRSAEKGDVVIYETRYDWDGRMKTREVTKVIPA